MRIADNPDGTLRARSLPGAVLDNAGEAAAQAVRLAKEGIAITTGSHTHYAPVDTLCIHGDTPGAVDFARSVRAALLNAEIKIEKFGGKR